MRAQRNTRHGTPYVVWVSLVSCSHPVLARWARLHMCRQGGADHRAISACTRAAGVRMSPTASTSSVIS